jgi:hypothetical protein
LFEISTRRNLNACAHPPGKFPDNHFDECGLCQIEVFAKQEQGVHRDQYANRARVVNKPNGGCSCAEENSSRLTSWSCAVTEGIWEQIVVIYMTMDRVMFVSQQTAVPKSSIRGCLTKVVPGNVGRGLKRLLWPRDDFCGPFVIRAIPHSWIHLAKVS